MCNQYVPIRAGTDIAFLGGLINYVIQNDRWFREYVLAYTNAATLVTDEFVDADELGGVFSGYHAEKREYEPGHKRWNYQGEPENVPATDTPKEIKNESWSEKAGFANCETFWALEAQDKWNVESSAWSIPGRCRLWRF